MSSLVILLASTASALDCTGLDPQICTAANAAADRINDAAGQQLVYDAHPSSKQRPQFLYNRFQTTFADARAQCEWGFEVQGTIGAYWNRAAFGPRRFVGSWEDLDGSYGGEVVDGSWNGSSFYGNFDGDPEGRMGTYQAVYGGSEMWMIRNDGLGGGTKVGLGGGTGFFGNVYGDCAEEPTVEFDVYPVVGNTALLVGTPGEFEPALELTGSLFDNDPDAGDLIVTGVHDGFALCDDDTAPFDCHTASGGLLRVFEDGTFMHLPPSGAPVDTVDFFGIEIGRVGSTGRTYSDVELQHVGRVWYADSNGFDGDGGSYGPALSLDGIVGPIESGDTVYIAGSVEAGSGLVLGGDVRVLGGTVPLTVDGMFQGSPITLPITTNMEPRGEVRLSGAPFLTVQAGGAPEDSDVYLEGLEIVGQAGPQGMIHVYGPDRFDLTLDQVSLYSWGGDAPAVRVEQPYGGHYGAPGSNITVRNSQFEGGMTAFDIQQGDERSTSLVLDDVQFQIDGTVVSATSTDFAVLSMRLQNSFVEASQGLFDLQLDQGTETRVELEAVEGTIASGDAFRITSLDGAQLDVDVRSVQLEVGATLFAVDLYEYARVQFDLTDAVVYADQQILRVTNDGFGPGFGSTIENSELYASGGAYGPAIQVTGHWQATNRIAMGYSTLGNAGGSGPAVRIQGNDASTTSVTMLNNDFQRSPSVQRAVEFRTNASTSSMCLDFEANRSYGGPLSVYQQPGSAFSIAGLPGNGTNASYVRNYLQYVNPQMSVRVQDQSPYGPVNFGSVGGCELP